MSATPDFKERLSKITLRNSKVKHVAHKSWPMEKKIEVVSQFLVLGNLRMVAASTGVSYDLVRQWKIQPWWKEFEDEIRQTQNIEMDTKLSKIVDKSLDAVLDRVENGEYVYDQKTGEIKRRPAALRDIHKVSIESISKRELLRGNATERKEVTQIPVKEQLALLAAEFAKWQQLPKKPTIDVDVTDVTPKEITNAISEEWEEGLQEGGRLGQDSQDPSAGSSESEQGSEH